MPKPEITWPLVAFALAMACDPVDRHVDSTESPAHADDGEGVAQDGDTRNPCSDNPCLNGGTCSEHGNTYSCECTVGYEGTNCGVDVDGCSAAACFAGVECMDVAAPGVGYTCGECPAGFVGDGQDCAYAACMNDPCADGLACYRDLTAESGRVCVAPAISVGLGARHSCVLIEGGPVRCWGASDVGQTGAGHQQTIGDDDGEMAALADVDLGSGRTAVALSVHSKTSCVVLDDGTAKCWGGPNWSGNLGQGDDKNRGDDEGEMGDNLPAIDLGTDASVKAISAGGFHVCAILVGGAVKCWGDNVGGTLGLGDETRRGTDQADMGDNLPVVALGTNRTATAISAGSSHTCALLDDGSVKCWGRNTEGQLGLEDTEARGDNEGEMGDNLPAVDLGADRKAVAISVGGTHSCALLDDGAVKCWGANGSFELGLGDTEYRGDDEGEMGDNLPAIDLGDESIVVAISQSSVILDDGRVKRWGANWFGALGHGNLEHRGGEPEDMGDNLPAISVGGYRTAIVISSTPTNACVVLDDASVKCWGLNEDGQLGLGDTQNRGDEPGEMGDHLPVIRHSGGD